MAEQCYGNLKAGTCEVKQAIPMDMFVKHQRFNGIGRTRQKTDRMYDFFFQNGNILTN